MGAAVGPVHTVLRETAVLEVEADHITGGYWSTGCIGISWPPYVVVSRTTLLPHLHHRYL